VYDEMGEAIKCMGAAESGTTTVSPDQKDVFGHMKVQLARLPG